MDGILATDRFVTETSEDELAEIENSTREQFPDDDLDSITLFYGITVNVACNGATGWGGSNSEKVGIPTASPRTRTTNSQVAKKPGRAGL